MKTPTRLFAPLALTSLLLGANVAHAQTYQPSNRIPVADKTQIGTQVSGGNNNFNITGGLQRGQTLFHSFSDFSVPTSGQANFANPVGNRDIITRVTGGLFSDINGRIDTNNANFFLINPNGVVFGPNAQLNVGKAFVGSTANSIDLVDGSGRTITFGANANGDAPLLSVNPNVFFNVSRLNMGGGTGAINNFGTLQTPNNSQYIGLIGGNVTLDGSAGGGKIIAPGGRVDIGGLKSAGTVTVGNRGLVFSSNGVGRSNVLLTNSAGITVRATGTLDTVNTFFNNATTNGSSINISANNLDILNSGVKLNDQPAALDAGLGRNSGVQTAATGGINIDAFGKFNLNNSDIKNTIRVGSEGMIGDIKIQAGDLDIKNNSAISSLTAGTGNAGNIDIKVSKDLNLTSSSTIISDNALETARGHAGDINIKANGDINISGYNSTATNLTSSGISSDTQGQGDAGKITIDTQGKLALFNKGAIVSRIFTTAVGNSNGIEISARELQLANNSYISSRTSQTNRVEGKGNAGDINIKTTGDINVSGYDSSLTNPTLSYISSDTSGYGNTGKVTINTQGKLSIVNYGNISSNLSDTAVGNSKGIDVVARELTLSNNSVIGTGSLPKAQGNAGDINIETTGNINISGSESASASPTFSNISSIESSTNGQGNAGKITIDSQGKLSLINRGNILSTVGQTAVGNGKSINIAARELELANGSSILTVTVQTKPVDGKGNAGDINIKTTGDINVSGYDSSLLNPITSNLSQINSSTTGFGDSGKITIDTQGKLAIFNKGNIASGVFNTALGNSKGISINSRELELANNSYISTNTFQTALVNGKGNAGDINIKTTGNIKLTGYDPASTNPNLANKSNSAQISSSTYGGGDAGKISIDTQGKLSLVNEGVISSAIVKTAVGNSQGIKINARELELFDSNIFTATFQSAAITGKGNAGDINIKTTGDTRAEKSSINSSSAGNGDTGKITINTQGKLSFVNAGLVSSDISKQAIGNGQGISIAAREMELNNGSFITSSTDQITPVNGKGNAGDIDLKIKQTISFNNLAGVSTRSTGSGEAGNVSIDASRVSLSNTAFIISDATSVSGANVTLAISDLLLMKSGGLIATNSGSTQKNGNGGDITISSPLIIATPGDNDITANANGGNGGNINITSQGLFGIQYRPKAQDSLFTNDITASSTFGQNGSVNISTPGTDPGRDKGELTAVPDDASKKISQACGESQRANKFYIIGKGGHPQNAEDPLTSEVVWHDPRGVKTQPVTSQTTRKLAPAVGWVFDGKGKVTLISAQTEGAPIGTKVVCPQEGK
ncbi:filamentous hemagglutinin N-terminal domain-containing protein [Chamaesiphon sp. VAR_48_metabat_135_sub]|uniref:beta strand repeat-containing protein n=1 Tax=Chamaesiphon sp. VAR_48_metabat_135_sub TaxID=2964699 RepID=UPI00286AAA49|nr:filamentous hemagglutinin N-terminal domain-containing protein [Chamaesiphon sp. VAR_48_metabat_135_sub]